MKHTTETKPAFFRPENRRLIELTNEELQSLFELRASKIKLDPKGFWNNERIVYWADMIPKLADLYLVMLEIQSRYPEKEMYPEKPNLLPVNGFIGTNED